MQIAKKHHDPAHSKKINQTAFSNQTSVDFCDEIEAFVSCEAMLDQWNHGVHRSRSLSTYCFLVNHSILQIVWDSCEFKAGREIFMKCLAAYQPHTPMAWILSCDPSNPTFHSMKIWRILPRCWSSLSGNPKSQSYVARTTIFMSPIWRRKGELIQSQGRSAI